MIEFVKQIQQFPRGVNPMVSVNYGNSGTNGGQFTSRPGTTGTGQINLGRGQAYLPYRVNREGAFRPPIIPPQDLLPLSRQPRLPTCGQCNIGSGQMARFNTLNTCAKDLKAVRDELVQVCAAPRLSFNIPNTPNKPTETENHIHNKPKTAVNSKIIGKSYILGVNPEPERGIRKNRDQLYASVPSNPYKNIRLPTEAYKGLQPISIKDNLQIIRSFQN